MPSHLCFGFSHDSHDPLKNCQVKIFGAIFSPQSVCQGSGSTGRKTADRAGFHTFMSAELHPGKMSQPHSRRKEASECFHTIYNTQQVNSGEHWRPFLNNLMRVKHLEIINLPDMSLRKWMNEYSSVLVNRFLLLLYILYEFLYSLCGLCCLRWTVF